MRTQKGTRNGLWEIKLFLNEKAVCERHCSHTALFLFTLRSRIRSQCRSLRSSKTPFLAPKKGGDDRIPASTL